MKIEAKTFYQTIEDDSDDAKRWVEYVPTKMPVATRRRFDSAAIQIFKTCDRDIVLNNHSSYHTSFIKIQSPLIIEQLKKLLETDEITFKANHAQVNEPFLPLYFIWDELRRAKAEADRETARHLDVLLKFMDSDLGDTLIQIRDMEASGRITHDLSWALFPRGTYVLSYHFGYSQVFRVNAVGYGGRSRSGPNELSLRCEYVQFDGYEYGYSETTFNLPAFHGTKAITSLNVVPWAYINDSEALKKRIIDRGRKILEYQGIAYLSYKGIGLMPISETVKIFQPSSV